MFGARASIVVSAGLVAAIAVACGGSTSSSPSPTSPTTTQPSGVSACGAIVRGVASFPSIVQGTACTLDSSVVLVNLRDKDGQPIGSCSGTVIAPRAVLTAAHCLEGDTASVRIFPGTGADVLAESFSAHPSYRPNDSSSLDLGIVITSQDINRVPVRVLVSRDARIGEQAVIAGWGKDQLGNGTILRAGTTTISSVGATFLQTQAGGTTSSVCQGDSGGPLLLSEGGVWAIAGVTSAVTVSGSCTAGTNFYTNVRHPDSIAFIFGRVPDGLRQ
jgi:V8-like Glu-specific endopeptidase